MRERQGQGGLEEQLKNVFWSTLEAEVCGFDLFVPSSSPFYLFGHHEKGPAVWLVPDRAGEYKVVRVDEQQKLSGRSVSGHVVHHYNKRIQDLRHLDPAHSWEKWAEGAAREFARKIDRVFVDVLVESSSGQSKTTVQSSGLQVSLARVVDGLRQQGYEPSHVLFSNSCRDRLIEHRVIERDEGVENRRYVGKTRTGLRAFCSTALQSDMALVLDRQKCTLLVAPPWARFGATEAESEPGVKAEQYLNPIVRDTRAVVALVGVEESLGYSRESDVVAMSSSAVYVDPQRIEELRECTSKEWDLTRLIALCKELNRCWSHECFLAVAMLTRAVLDHVPPIFRVNTFSQVANNYAGCRSFKKSMQHLENSLRNIADSHLHVHIRKKETLPNATQVNFSQDLDMLLSELVRILK